MRKDTDRVGSFPFEGEPTTPGITNQTVYAYRCPCGHPECRVIALHCESEDTDGDIIQDIVFLSPMAWTDTIKKIQSILDEEFPFR